MKFVIEGRGLISGGGRVGLLNLLPAIAAQGRHEYVALLPEDLPIDSSNVRVVLTPRSTNLLAREWWLNTSVGKICREDRADALLCLGNFAPHFPPVPTVIRLQNAYYVVRDASALRGLTARERLIIKYGREHFRHLAGNVIVVVQTEFMRERLLAENPISPSRAVVIPDCGMRFPAFPDRRTNLRKDAASPFTFISVALCTPNKNLNVLVDAVKKLRSLTKNPFRCLLTIDTHQHPAGRRLLARIEREAVGDLLVNVGSLPPERLSAAYKSADAFILPTLIESFGRPYDEAMQFGLPILTSDRDFAHERCRDAALYFDPLDAESVARAMARAIEDADLRYRLVENGQHMLAQALNWEEIAANFVEVLERTAREQGCEKAPGTRQKAESGRQEAEVAVRTLFNQKARRWRSKYGPKGKLSSRVEQFIARLGELCPPPANILDLGCGTGEIAAAMNRMAYHVTACDVAEEMLDVARGSHSESAVKWVYLAPDREVLPFASGSFDGVVASSVFEYLDDVPCMAAELARILRPEGVLLLTVPNPCNVVRRVEARLRSVLAHHRFPPLLRRVQRADSYAAYLRLSRNRFDAAQWQSVLNAAKLTALDERDFSPETWRDHAKSPLVLLAVKKAAARGVDESLVLSHAARE